MRALLFNSNCPMEFWGEALLHATYLYNRTPHSTIGFKTPYELKNNQRPDISYLRIFGSITYYKLKDSSVGKLSNQSNKAILIGIGNNIFKIYDPTLNKKLWVRDVKILENQFYDFNNPTTINPITDIVELPVNPPIKDIEHSSPTSTNTMDIVSIPSYDDSIDELALLMTSLDIRLPTTYKQAIESSEKEHWIQAMQAEIDELGKQNTWKLVQLPPKREALRGRWVYTVKTDSNNIITKYKARYVVQGFNQTLGLDYIDTFSTTCRPETYRAIFVIALFNKWPILQYDVKNAFVHADIDAEVYIEQPIGFNQGPLVCRLQKALYGLKQSPRL